MRLISLVSTLSIIICLILCAPYLAGCGARPGTDDGGTGSTSKPQGSGSGSASGSTSSYTDSDADGASDACEVEQGTDPLNASEVPDYCPDDNTNYICELYEKMKEQDELLNGQNDIPSQSPTLTCDTNTSELTELDVSVKYGALRRDLMFVTNGVISIKPWYMYDAQTDLDYGSDWKQVEKDTSSWWVEGISLDLGSLFSHAFYRRAYQYDHHFGADASAERDCPRMNIATVSVNGSEHEWAYPGFLTFRLPEYVDRVTSASDIVSLGNVVDPTNYPVFYKGAFTNGYADATHIIEVHNKISDFKKNNKCREITVNFSISYCKAKGSTTPTSESELDKLCADYLNK